jgi:hydroxymethylpyrimidine/phosphomethylpyrimidine kinase
MLLHFSAVFPAYTDAMADAVPDEIASDDTRRVPLGPVRHATVLVAAGLDPSGGAGLLADVCVVAQHGFHAAGVATALTEQDSVQCTFMHPVPPEVVGNQLARLVDDFEVRAVKVGMLANGDVARVVAQALGRLAQAGVPIVVDPVLRASRGVHLLEGTPMHALGPILELATLATPNLDELAALTGRAIDSLDELREGARRLRARGPRAVLAKGGHLAGDPVDVLADAEGEFELGGRRVEGPPPHGTGCALSTEIACRLALGTPLRTAVTGACERVRARIAEARAVGRGLPFLG